MFKSNSAQLILKLLSRSLLLQKRFLASGSTFSDMAIRFVLGISTISTLVRETMTILWDVLYPIHMPVPDREQFLKISEDFWKNWNFPHCIGAIDGRHIRIKCPANSGSKYFNYKRFYSIVLQALVDSNCKFVVIDVGGYGSQSDGGTFQASDLYKALKENLIQIPKDDKLPNSRITLPYFFIGDGAYPLMQNLMKPYPGTSLSVHERVYNKRLSRARMVVERSFGFLCRKWGIFSTAIQQTPEIAELVAKCTCILHNVILDLEKNISVCDPSSDPPQDSLLSGKETNNFIAEYGTEVRHELTLFISKNPLY